MVGLEQRKSKKISWAEAYLNGILSLKQWISVYNVRLAEIQDEMISYGGGGIGERVQTSPRGDALEKRVIRALERYGEIQEALFDKRDELWRKQDIAINRIMSLKDGNRKTFLMLHYIEGLNLVEISLRLGHSEPSRIYHLKDEALQYFEHEAVIHGWKK